MVFFSKFSHNDSNMTEEMSTFERLVLTLASSERQELLNQIAESGEITRYESQLSAIPEHPVIDDGSLPQRTLSGESFFFRLWCKLRAFFTSTSVNLIYSGYLIKQLGKKIERTASPYVDIRRKFFTENFYTEIVKLKDMQAFFTSLLAAYENDKGGFYIILASLLMPDTYEQLATASDPFSVPWEQDSKSDIRLSMLRKMDSILSKVSEEERSTMYQSARSIEWIRFFCQLPLTKMLSRFAFQPGSNKTCMIDSLSSELVQLVDILSSAKNIPVLMLEALYLFSVQDEIEEKKFNFEKECRSFVSAATNHLSRIVQMKANIPFISLVRYTLRDISWQPSLKAEGEDWFALFRIAWKSRFEKRWSRWSRLHRKAMLERDICIFLGTTTIPTLAFRPWAGIWLVVSLYRELSLCFLKGVFTSCYPAEWLKPLKILLLEGEFYRRENLAEYTEAYSIMEHQQQIIEAFENRLSPKGDIGEGFTIVQRENIATVAGKTRIENLMLTINSEAEQIISMTVSAFRSIEQVLGGILSVDRGGPYETLINLASIQGKQNERYRKELEHIRQMVIDACRILSDAEELEKDSL